MRPPPPPLQESMGETSSKSINQSFLPFYRVSAQENSTTWAIIHNESSPSTKDILVSTQSSMPLMSFLPLTTSTTTTTTTTPFLFTLLMLDKSESWPDSDLFRAKSQCRLSLFSHFSKLSTSTRQSVPRLLRGRRVGLQRGDAVGRERRAALGLPGRHHGGLGGLGGQDPQVRQLTASVWWSQRRDGVRRSLG